jgi:uncharacterized membrane protein
MGERAALRGARAAAKGALLAEPFDRARLEAALADLRVATGKNQELLHRILAEAAATSPLEARKELAEALEGPGMRRGRPFR